MGEDLCGVVVGVGLFVFWIFGGVFFSLVVWFFGYLLFGLCEGWRAEFFELVFLVFYIFFFGFNFVVLILVFGLRSFF